MLKRKLESNLRPRLRGQIWTRAAAALTLTVTPSLHESLLVLWDIGQSNQETEGTSSDDAVAKILSQSGGGPESSSWDGGPNRTVKSYVLAVRFLSPHLIADRRLPLQRIISHGKSCYSAGIQSSLVSLLLPTSPTGTTSRSTRTGFQPLNSSNARGPIAGPIYHETGDIRKRKCFNFNKLRHRQSSTCDVVVHSQVQDQGVSGSR